MVNTNTVLWACVYRANAHLQVILYSAVIQITAHLTCPDHEVASLSVSFSCHRSWVSSESVWQKYGWKLFYCLLWILVSPPWSGLLWSFNDIQILCLSALVHMWRAWNTIRGGGFLLCYKLIVTPAKEFFRLFHHIRRSIVLFQHRIWIVRNWEEIETQEYQRTSNISISKVSQHNHAAQKGSCFRNELDWWL